MRRVALLLGLALAVSVAGAVWLRTTPRPNLLLITLDTTRADRLGCYGYRQALTPHLDALARDGVRVERACTVAPLTLPAHASLFTGLYPAENGVRTNGRGRLDDALPTLAAELRTAGYDTGAFVASFVLNGKFGLDQGFAVYDDDFAGDGPAPDALHRHRRGESVVDAALKWLGGKRATPFFCWVHLYDPHAPYVEHRDLFGDTFADRPYDAEIAYVDRQVGRLLAFLAEQKLDESTLVVVVGDHGEGLGDHLEREHSLTLYDEALHVPLMLRHTGRLSSSRSVAGTVSLVDLSPTVLDLLGQRDTRKISGASFAASLRGGDAPRSACYSATDDPFLLNGWSPLRSVTDGSWKYIRTTKPELYDLASDPAERTNLFESQRERAAALDEKLTSLEAQMTPRSETDVQLTPAEKRALESLGYGAGARARAADAGPAPGDLPDVKDMLPFEVAVDQAEEELSRGEPAQAAARLRDVIAQAPTQARAYWALAMALRAQGDLDGAGRVFHDLVTINTNSREGHHGLGLVALEQGRFDEAVEEFQKTIQIDPEFGEAHFNLAVTYLRRQDDVEALAHLNALLDIDECHAVGYRLRSELHDRQGRRVQAIADLQKALKYAPP